jgi:positive regulator of sigma E activity
MVKFRIFASMNESILHKGIVVSASSKQLTVDVVSDNNDCQGCGIAPLCNIKSGNRLTLPLGNASSTFRSGQRVILRTSGKSALKSATVLFILPTILIISTTVAMSLARVAEETAAITALVVGAIYFTLLYVMKKLTASAVRWIVEPAEK